MCLTLFVVQIVHVDQAELDANPVQLVECLTHDLGRIRVGKMVRLRELLLKVFDVEGGFVEQWLESEEPLAMSDGVHGLPFLLLLQSAASAQEVNAIPFSP